MTKTFKILLTLWLCLGASTSGFFYILRKGGDFHGYEHYNHWYLETSLLITLVGSIFIIGIGLAFKKNSNK